MGVKIKGSYVVKPAEPTWNGIRSLSELDQIGVMTHIPTIYFYKNVGIRDWIEPPSMIIDTLKDSLSRALVPFYPLAGRLCWVDNGAGLELECNAMGVELIEAESGKLMTNFGDFSSFEGFEDLYPRVDYSLPIQDHPLFLVQLTWFQCGGIALGVSSSHAVSGGLSTSHFLREWARLARSEPLEAAPFLDRQILQPNKNTLTKECSSKFDQMEYFFPPLPKLVGEGGDSEELKKTIGTALALTKTQVDLLKMAANRDIEHGYKKRPYGRFEAIVAHIWRCACKAREHVSEQMTALSFCVDSRNRMDPPLPPRYFGNAIVDVVALCQVGELMSRPLSHACQKIREENEKVTGDYVWSLIKLIQEQRRLPKQGEGEGGTKGLEEGPLYGNPNVVVSSWLNLPLRGLDFGWGKEVYMGPATHDFDGDIMILPGYINDGSVVVVAGLQETHMEKFKKFFYEEIEILCQGSLVW